MKPSKQTISKVLYLFHQELAEDLQLEIEGYPRHQIELRRARIDFEKTVEEIRTREEIKCQNNISDQPHQK